MHGVVPQFNSFDVIAKVPPPREGVVSETGANNDGGGDGELVGDVLGLVEGEELGDAEGDVLGELDGDAEGEADGDAESGVGSCVGARLVT